MLRALCALLLLLLVGCDGATCDPAELQARLDAAQPGDTVYAGACVLDGSFRVPAGVTLEGVGATQSAIEALPGNLQALQIDTSPGLTTTVRGFSVGGPTPVLVRVTGDGDAQLVDLGVDLTQGTAVEAAGGGLVLRDSIITGPINASNATDPVFRDPDPAVVGVYGLVLDGVEARIEGSTLTGLARAAVTSRGGAGLTFDDCQVRDTLGHGLIVQGVALTLTRTEIATTFQGLRGEPAMAAALSDVELSAEALTLRDNERYGLVQRGGGATIEASEATANGDAAFWLGELDAATVRDVVVDGGAFAGLVVEGAASLDVDGLEVRAIATQRRNVGVGDLFGDVAIGDGLHVLQVDAVTLVDVALVDNERAGLILDLAGASPPSFTDVRAEASGAGLGAIAGRFDPSTPFVLSPDAPGTWDMGITREGAAIDNDAMLAGPIDALGAGAPAELPAVP